MTSEPPKYRTVFALLVVGVAVALGACGSDERASTDTAPVEIVEVDDDVDFYPACGNETLDHDGVTWYTVSPHGFEDINPDLAERVEELLAVDRERSPVVGMQGLVQVAPPGPGDDTGTLVVWADGVARWVSDNGELDVWMVDDEITYNWVC